MDQDYEDGLIKSSSSGKVDFVWDLTHILNTTRQSETEGDDDPGLAVVFFGWILSVVQQQTSLIWHVARVDFFVWSERYGPRQSPISAYMYIM